MKAILVTLAAQAASFNQSGYPDRNDQRAQQFINVLSHGPKDGFYVITTDQKTTSFEQSTVKSIVEAEIADVTPESLFAEGTAQDKLYMIAQCFDRGTLTDADRAEFDSLVPAWDALPAGIKRRLLGTTRDGGLTAAATARTRDAVQTKLRGN